MTGNERSTGHDSDQDTAPDLSENGWPEKFARATVRRGRPSPRQTESVDHYPHCRRT